jgi:hypothetical protein
MCKPCYKVKKNELAASGFAFTQQLLLPLVKAARLTEPLTRLAAAIATEAAAALVEKENNTIKLSGTFITATSTVTDPSLSFLPSVQDASGNLSNIVKCGVVVFDMGLKVTRSANVDTTFAARTFKKGAIVRYLPATIVQVANRERALLEDLSGWITVRIKSSGQLIVSDFVDPPSDSEDEHLVDEIDDDGESSGDAQSTKPALPDDDLELVTNAKYDAELLLSSDNFVESFGDSDEGSGSHIGYQYESISSIWQLVTFADKNGNTAAHHAVNLGLPLTLASLVSSSANVWKKNAFWDTPASLQYLPLNSGKDKNAFFASLHRRGLVPKEALSAALSCPVAYKPSSEFDLFIKSVKDLNENDACYFAEDALQREVPHALLYRAAFRLLFSYGPLLAKQDLDQYLKEIVVTPSDGITTDRKPFFIDPLYYYCLYLLWKRPSGGGCPSHSTKDRLLAYDAIRALRMFPSVYNEWMDPKETLEKEIEESGIANIIVEDVEEDDYSDILPPPGSDDPEMVWERAKTHYKLKSPSLDLLMQMIGLKDVKERAISVALTVLLSPPPDLKCQTSMNFLFVGNPGE